MNTLTTNNGSGSSFVGTLSYTEGPLGTEVGPVCPLWHIVRPGASVGPSAKRFGGSWTRRNLENEQPPLLCYQNTFIKTSIYGYYDVFGSTLSQPALLTAQLPTDPYLET